MGHPVLEIQPVKHSVVLEKKEKEKNRKFLG